MVCLSSDMVRLIVMCKAPVPGKVKTRLMDALSAEEAARLHQSMAETVIGRAKRLFRDVRIAADDPAHPFFARFDLPLIRQGEGSLGERMTRLMHRLFATDGRAVMFLGTDSPHMADARLLMASRWLQEVDVVVGPVEDGGYDLIGLTHDWPVFDNVSWSTTEVLQQTLANCARLGLSSRLLDVGFDIDTAIDLARARNAGWLN